MPNVRTIKCSVESVVDHGDGVYSVTFHVSPQLNRFRPGQFVHLALDSFDPAEPLWPESRVFSIASEPNSEELKIVYSVKGTFTTRMSHELKEGREVWLKYPYGNFTVDRYIVPSTSIVLIAGGTGMSPFVPYLKSNLLKVDAPTICLVYAIRKLSMFVFKSELLEVIERLSTFSVYLFVEELSKKTELLDRRIDITVGRPSVECLIAKTSKLASPVFFVSGPPGMIDYFRTGLLERKVEAERVVVDEWE